MRLAISTVAMFCFVVSSWADESQPAATPDPAEMQKIWKEYSTPGEQHEELKKMVGKWKTETTSFMENPDVPAKSEGTATFKSILGGRYVQQEFVGTFEGQKFEGMGISGYDNHLKRYVSVWFDTMGTGVLKMNGKMNKKSDKLTETGIFDCPMGKTKMRTETKFVSDDEMHMIMYMTMAPKTPEVKTMEIVYTRMK